jgi:hypothetical protein
MYDGKGAVTVRSQSSDFVLKLCETLPKRT